ncbi:flagellar export chaperone FliS [Tepidibacter formicigenes]|jgi:flagellar protein FliS|uniref:Flagellar protein FliS n=1 Tax=Tepidibacter formicigenes DSM 15518 TaxID=1123349 RepID=A0A1M6SGV0_9FIRM|nr:flagellar export chaperone FliS [Tepidibacter formicigenes]SHK44014.1 flagellar protein FliS [Tepidibacter formicigenes DSM 15518]
MIEKQYLASRVATANEAQLVAILYEGLIDTLKECINYIDSDRENFNKSINKSRDIISEFIATLKGGSEITNNYKSLYLYINKLITDADIKKDKSKLEEAIKIVTPLYEGWSELGEKIYKENIDKNKGPRLVAGMTYGKGYVNDYVVNSENRWEKG